MDIASRKLKKALLVALLLCLGVCWGFALSAVWLSLPDKGSTCVFNMNLTQEGSSGAVTNGPAASQVAGHTTFTSVTTQSTNPSKQPGWSTSALAYLKTISQVAGLVSSLSTFAGY